MTVAVRGTFDVVPDGALTVAAEQEPFQWEDCYDGEPAAVPLMRQGDLEPFKPGTDVTVLADAVCPEPAGAPSWVCGLRVVGASGVAVLDKRLRVTGPRWWRQVLRTNWLAALGQQSGPLLQGWKLREPDVARVVPMDWRLARGGPLPDEPSAVDVDNPVGRGIVGRTGPAPHQAWPAPQVEAVDAPRLDWQTAAAPCGLGPVSPWWRGRARHCGSGELVWLDDKRPVLPPDFDEQFWQCAPPDQVVSPWLRGTERYELMNLHAEHARLAGTLPGVMLGLVVERDGEAMARRACASPSWSGRALRRWRPTGSTRDVPADAAASTVGDDGAAGGAAGHQCGAGRELHARAEQCAGGHDFCAVFRQHGRFLRP